MKNLSKVFLMCSFFLFAVAVQMWGQQKMVTGQVIDSSNEPIPGVNVQIKGASTGVITDLDGKFSISVPRPTSVLAFKFVGYATREVTVGNQTRINVSLNDNSQNLDEVVVIGYGSARKGDVTGAASLYRPDETDAMKASSISSLLQGKVAGVNITSSVSTPGAASSIIIRGANSLRGDNQPLYVIDNIPQNSTGEFASSAFGGADVQIAQDPLAGLNPSDIEDITILKDASATAIYGSRGANGVILVTTKKGKSGKAKVNVTANFTVANARNLHDMINLEEFAAYANSKVNPGEESYYLQSNGEMHYIFAGGLPGYLANPGNPEYYRVLTYKNWQKEAYKSSFSQQYNANISGGKDGITYFVSAGYKNIKGIVDGTGIKQGDIRANLSADLSKAVNVKFVLSGSLLENNMLSGGNTSQNIAGAFTRTVISTAPYEIPADDPVLGTAIDAKTNVYSWLNDYVDISTTKNFSASMDLQWKIYKDLTYNLRAGGGLVSVDRNRWYGMTLTLGANNDGLLGISNLKRSNYTVENMLNYNKNITKDINLSAMVAMTYTVNKYLDSPIQATNFSNKSLREKGLHMASIIKHGQPIQKDYQLLSYLGRVNLSFYDKYLLTASVRSDGSSKFKKGSRWATFSSFSAAWRIEQEQFMKSLDFLSQLKLRVGYGETGSQAIQPYATFSDYAHTIDYENSGNILAQNVSNLQNDQLQWERTSSWNLGLDFGFFDGRLSGTVDLYQKNTNHLLINRTLPPSSGFASVLVNQGKLTNKGVEISLDAEILKMKKFSWSVGGNIGINRGVIDKLGFEPADFGSLKGISAFYGGSAGDLFGGVANIFIAGEQPGLFWGYKTQGIIQTEDIVDGKVAYIAKDGSTKYYSASTVNELTAGSIKGVDVNEDGVIDASDQAIIGNPNPKFNYGFQTRMNYMGFTLSAQFNGVYGNQLFNANARFDSTPSKGTGNLHRKAFQNMWTPENHSNLYPSSNSNLRAAVYDRYIEDASYLRCSDITLGYDLPKKLMHKIGFNNINVFASGKNLFVITKYSGYDPEVGTFAFDGTRPGYDYSSYPSMRSFILGLNVTF